MTDNKPLKSMMRRFLVIDDEESVRSTLRDILEEVGYEVTEAADGKQGRKLLGIQRFRHGKDTPVHVVITDMVMPGKDGTVTILELRRIYHAVKIIAISGGGRDYLRMAKVLGADKILTKPFTADELIEAVREVSSHLS